LRGCLLVWLEALVLVVPHLKKAPFVELYGDVVMGGTTSSIGLMNSFVMSHLT